MPEIGEIKQVLYKESRKHIYIKCPNCKEERWMQLRNYERGVKTGLCFKCFNSRRGYKSSKTKSIKVNTDRQGYKYLRLEKDNFFFLMADSRGYVREHRLIMAKHLGRCLQTWEIVHHKNGIKDDNQIENLQLVSDDRHKQITNLENRIKILEARLNGTK